MFDIHPDDNHHRIRIRQEIVQNGVRAARRPGDIAAIREKIGHILIVLGERVRGYEARPVMPSTRPTHATRLAR